MAENQPEVTEDQGGEPAESKPELMGYKSVEDLVAAKVASDQEAKRIIEERDALRARLAEQESRNDQPPADRANGQGRDRYEERRKGVEEWAAKNDDVADYTLMLEERLDRLENSVSNAFEVERIKDEKLQADVVKHFNRNRHRLGDITAARKEIMADRLAQEKTSLTEENTKLKAELEASRKKPPTDVIRTATREITSQRNGNTTESMTEAEFDQRQAELKAQGPAGYKLALKEQLRLERDEITLRKY